MSLGIIYHHRLDEANVSTFQKIYQVEIMDKASGLQDNDTIEEST